MRIDNCLILSAGFGKRMGKIGEMLPKPLWPIGDKTLLEYQYELVKSIGIKNIFVNISHQGNQITSFLSQKKLKVNIVEEATPIEVGGSLQNLVNMDVKGNCLIINSDQLILNFNDLVSKMEKLYKDMPTLGCLASVVVAESDPYNRFVINDEKLIAIQKYNKTGQNSNSTYAGVGIINLNLLPKKKLETISLFELIFQNKQKNDILIYPANHRDFFDVGTKEKYAEFLFNNYNNDSFKFLNLKKFFQNNFFNFSDNAWEKAPAGSIVLSGEEFKLPYASICYGSIFDQL